MKKIALVVSGLSSGGVESFILSFFNEINSAREYDKYIITHNAPSKVAQEKFENLGFKIFIVPSKKESIFNNIKSLNKIMKDNKFDIVHSHMAKSNFIIMKLAKKNNVPIRIAHSHQSMSINGTLKKMTYKILQFLNRRYANIFLGCSEAALIYGFGEEILSDKYSSTVIHNAIDLKKFKYNSLYRKELREKYNISENQILIGSIGRYTFQKNQLFLLEVVKKIVEKNRDFKLLLIGEGELKNDYLEYIKNNKLEQNIILEQPQNDIYKYYSAFDIFAFPSRFEGLGIVVIEAQASGLSCIVSKNVPIDVKISDLIDYVDIDSIEKWYDKIVNFKKNSNRNYDLSKSDYNIKNEYKKLIYIYDEGSVNKGE